MNTTNILLGVPDYRKLTGVVAALRQRRSLRAPHLLRLASELSMAVVLDADTLPGDVVRIGSSVRIVDRQTEREQRVRIVFPAELDGGPDRVSILAPLGTALIGERAGTIVVCAAPGGDRAFLILEVDQTLA